MGLLAVLVVLSIGTAVNAQQVLLNGSPNPINLTTNGQTVTVSVTGTPLKGILLSIPGCSEHDVPLFPGT